MKYYQFLFLILISANLIAQETDDEIINLQETIIYDKSKFKLKRVGPDTKTKTIQIGLSADVTSSDQFVSERIKEIAVHINAPNKSFRLQQLNFNFSQDILIDSLEIEVDIVKNIESNQPVSLLNSPIRLIIKKDFQKDFIFTYDIKDLNIEYKGDFFILTKLITNLEKPIYFSGAMFNRCFYRGFGIDKWKKTPLGISPAINADILIKK